MTSKTEKPAATFSFVNEYPPADPAMARNHFLAKLSVETDIADVVADLTRGTGVLLLLDVRAAEDHARCRVPGA